jgi:ribose transport system permease protein
MRRFANLLAPLLGLIGVAILFAILTGELERYLSTANLRVVLAQTVIVAIGALGMTMIIISAGIDLSVGSTIALTSVITAVALREGLPPVLAIAAGIAAGESSVCATVSRSPRCASSRSSRRSACSASRAASRPG